MKSRRHRAINRIIFRENKKAIKAFEQYMEEFGAERVFLPNFSYDSELYRMILRNPRALAKKLTFGKHYLSDIRPNLIDTEVSEEFHASRAKIGTRNFMED